MGSLHCKLHNRNAFTLTTVLPDFRNGGLLIEFGERGGCVDQVHLKERVLRFSISENQPYLEMLYA